MKEYYEAHITMLGKPATIKPLVESLGWKFSAIDGDPVLGPGLKCYATTFFNPKKLSKEKAINELDNAAITLAYQHGVKVTRRKIELVIFDDRADKVNCDGGCPECN